MESVNSVDFSDLVISKALPLINHTAVFMYTLCDLLKPGPSDTLQSALPMYQLILISIVMVVWMVLFIYVWKMLYYVVDDPYATPTGPSPPINRALNQLSMDKILDYVSGYNTNVSK